MGVMKDIHIMIMQAVHEFPLRPPHEVAKLVAERIKTTNGITIPLPKIEEVIRGR